MQHVRETVDRPYRAFRDREDAGRQLADFLEEEGAEPDAVLAVPSGGLAVGRPVAEHFGLPFDVVLVRKLPLPFNPEAGFGAVTLERDIVLTDQIVQRAGLSDARIDEIADKVLEGLRERKAALDRVRRPVEPEGLDVIVVDDGLASGVTMRAALQQVRRHQPRSVSVAVPDAPARTVQLIEPKVHHLYCLVAQSFGSFAVASFYEEWYDLTDRETAEILRARPGEEEET